ncbi:hypothetical protein TNIN_377621 [Trichonephila inaurata madagascariensis]|uniref:Uncharacterized protein n=1 Tax=Trichonephila inaurata madagascariensis TaxID=2747483 RepID=A0A8X6YBL0_9ARAC|nr:hypothetical protein TNIN_377621 [Trichonephila inaurata madagascariensis]
MQRALGQIGLKWTSQNRQDPESVDGFPRTPGFLLYVEGLKQKKRKEAPGKSKDCRFQTAGKGGVKVKRKVVEGAKVRRFANKPDHAGNSSAEKEVRTGDVSCSQWIRDSWTLLHKNWRTFLSFLEMQN